MRCRHCSNESFFPFADLQNAPLSNAMLTIETRFLPEVYYSLVVKVCDRCFLVQVDEHKAVRDIFDSDYTYFSSYSQSWLQHAERFATLAITRFGLHQGSRVLEIASNDGYLLQYFLGQGIPVQGIDPAANTAAIAIDKGIPTIVDFFSRRVAEDQLVNSADLIIGNNVFAHVPDINDFSEGLRIALKPGGTISLEFPHLLQLIRESQFDTIYHEHFSYLSLAVTERILERAGLKLFDVEELSTHGGSLRVFASHAEDRRRRSPRLDMILEAEDRFGLTRPETYLAFQQQIDRIRAEFLGFLLEQRASGAKIAGYGAAAKGNTLLNYCGVKGEELISFVADVSPHKQGRFLPGSHIPVVSPALIDSERPDFIIIFPWNLRTEITRQLERAKEWGASFVTIIPKLQVW